MKKWALITGASQGIGRELAKLFAADGWNVVLVARDETTLQAVARELQKDGISVRILPKDLSVPGAAGEIFNTVQTEGIFIEALVNNAGFGVQGAFTETPLARHQALAACNMASLVELTHLFAREMVVQGRGRILNVASVVAFMPGPYLAMYYASKAFVYSFTCALGRELAHTGVTVTVLCPGLTKSEFHARAGIKRDGGVLMRLMTMSAESVAKKGFNGMQRGRAVVIAGWHNWMAVMLLKVLPMRLTRLMAGNINGD